MDIAQAHRQRRLQISDRCFSQFKDRETRGTYLVSARSHRVNAIDRNQVAAIRPFEFSDEVTGDQISVSISDQYSKITVNSRTYYFTRETGEFDGAATQFYTKGPIAL